MAEARAASVVPDVREADGELRPAREGEFADDHQVQPCLRSVSMGDPKGVSLAQEGNLELLEEAVAKGTYNAKVKGALKKKGDGVRKRLQALGAPLPSPPSNASPASALAMVSAPKAGAPKAGAPKAGAKAPLPAP